MKFILILDYMIEMDPRSLWERQIFLLYLFSVLNLKIFFFLCSIKNLHGAYICCLGAAITK